jgi:hypothetical protein
MSSEETERGIPFFVSLPLSQSAASEHAKHSCTQRQQPGKYLLMFDSYLKSIIADSSHDVAIAINKTTFRLS